MFSQVRTLLEIQNISVLCCPSKARNTGFGGCWDVGWASIKRRFGEQKAKQAWILHKTGWTAGEWGHLLRKSLSSAVLSEGFPFPLLSCVSWFYPPFYSWSAVYYAIEVAESQVFFFGERIMGKYSMGYLLYTVSLLVRCFLCLLSVILLRLLANSGEPWNGLWICLCRNVLHAKIPDEN